jgi:hypothetical protein
MPSNRPVEVIDIHVETPPFEPVKPNWEPPKPTGALKDNPKTEDLQSALGIRFHLKRSPNTNYFVYRINLPGITLPSADEGTPFIELPQPGDHIQFEQPLIVTFRVDKGLNNYFELHHWLKDISGFNPKKYAELNKNPEYTGYGIKSEILVSLLNAQKNVIRNLTYHECWPTSLSTLVFDAAVTEERYLTATCVFRFSDFSSTLDV